MNKKHYVSDILEPFDERLNEKAEPEVLTLTEKKGFVSQIERFNKRLATNDVSKYKLIKKYDFAFNPYLLWAGAIACNEYWHEAIISPAYPTFHVREGYDPSFVKWLLMGDPIQLRYDAISFGAVPRRRRAKVEDFLSIELGLLPSISEQRRIATILDAADELRKKRRESIIILDDLLQSVFLDMFGDPVTNPKGWEEMELIKLCENRDDIRCGPFGTQLQKYEFRNSGVPLWGIKHVNSGFSFPTDEFVSEKKAEQLSGYRLVPGDLVMTRKGTIGNCHIYPDGEGTGIMHSDLLRIRLSPQKSNAHFISDQFKFNQRIIHQLRIMSPGAVMPGINVSKLKKLYVEVPPISLQNSYEKIVRTVFKMKKIMLNHLSELDTLFASLQQRAFNGEL